MRNTHRSSRTAKKIASQWYAKPSAIGSNIAMKARNCTRRSFQPRKRSVAGFNFSEMLQRRASVRPPRSGRLNDDRHGPKAVFNIGAPDGWVLDSKSGVEQGLPCVPYPNGSS